MQGILIQQQEFTQQLLRILMKECQPSESLMLELKHQLESYFIEIKQLEYQLKEQSAKYCHNCAQYKQQMMEEFDKLIQQPSDANRIDDLSTELKIMQSCNQSLELSKSELTIKLNDSRNKFDELLKQRKEDKDNYRQQYESLKKKAQDKIHRLKDKIVVFQTQLQTFAIESEHLRMVVQDKSDQRLKDSQISMRQSMEPRNLSGSQNRTKLMNNKSQIKMKLKNILLEMKQLKQQASSMLLDSSKIVMHAKEQLQMYTIRKEASVSRHQTGTIIRRNNTPPEPSKIKLYFSQSQSIQSSPDRKLKTEKPTIANKRLTANRSSISKNLLAEFDASAQLTKFIKQYYNAEQQVRNSTGFHPKLF